MTEPTDALRELAAPPGDADSQVHEAVGGTRTAPLHQPYISEKQTIPEFTVQAVLAGALLGIVFGASSLYLVLAGRTDRLRLDPGGRAVDHAVPRVQQDLRHASGHHPGKQHHANGGFSRRVDRLRRRRHHARAACCSVSKWISSA